jgi:hypothetical protein
MTQARRVRLSAEQKTDLLSRWKAGQSLHQIGRAFSKSHVSIHSLLSQHGGIVPAPRRRSWFSMTSRKSLRVSLSALPIPETGAFSCSAVVTMV